MRGIGRATLGRTTLGRATLGLAAAFLGAGLWAAPAHADPSYAATISLTNGDFAWNSAGGLTNSNLTGTFNEVVTGDYSFTNTIPSFSTPYNFTFNGSLTLDGNPVGSVTIPGLNGSVDSLASSFASGLGSYGSLLSSIEAALISNQVLATTVNLPDNLIPGDASATTSSAITVAYNYASVPGGAFELGVGYSGSSAWGNFINGGLNSLTGASSTNDIFSAQGTLSTVPEPGSMLVLATGLLGLGLVVVRRRA